MRQPEHNTHTPGQRGRGIFWAHNTGDRTMTRWTRTESGGYTAETPAGNYITIARRGKVWSLILCGRGHVEREAYVTRGAAMADAADICQREQDEINALPGGGCG